MTRADERAVLDVANIFMPFMPRNRLAGPWPPVRYATARHEAAHAVVAWWLRAPLGPLHLDADFGGAVAFRSSRSRVAIGRDPAAYALRCVYIALAGVLEGTTYAWARGDHNRAGHSDDLDHAWARVTVLCPDHQLAMMGTVAHLLRRRILPTITPHIDRLAALAVSSGRLPAAAIRAQLRGLPRPSIPDVESVLRSPLAACVDAGCLPPVDSTGRRRFEDE